MWQKKIKKTIFTLNIDNYDQNIREITYPLISKYAEKIGAYFYIIKDRKFPDMPVVYEKLQIYELAQQMENDWNIYIDSDALIHPDLMDITTLIPKDTVMQWGSDPVTRRFRNNRYFLRDGRSIGCCNWFTIASDLCIDLWKPPDETLESLVNEIYPIAPEETKNIDRSHFIDDYVLSYNIAKYGLKYTTLKNKLIDLGQKDCEYFWHYYLCNNDKKIEKMKQVLARWEFMAKKKLHPLESKEKI